MKTEIEEKGKSAKGRAELLKHLDGGRFTMKQMLQAKCYECMGYYLDGKVDCIVRSCPLYSVMPYREGEKRAFVKRSKRVNDALASTRGGLLAINNE